MNIRAEFRQSKQDESLNELTVKILCSIKMTTAYLTYIDYMLITEAEDIIINTIFNAIPRNSWNY